MFGNKDAKPEAKKDDAPAQAESVEEKIDGVRSPSFEEIVQEKKAQARDDARNREMQGKKIRKAVNAALKD